MSAHGVANLIKATGKVLEVCEEVRIDREIVLFIDHLDFNRFAEIHCRRALNIQNGGIGDSDLNSTRKSRNGRYVVWSHLYAITHVLRLKNDFPDGLNPFLTTRNRIG